MQPAQIDRNCRRYRLQWSFRGPMLFIFVAGSVFFAVSLADHSGWGIVGISLAVAIGGLYESIYALTSEVVLHRDAVEVRSLFGSKKVEFQKIRGRREYATGRRTRNTYLQIEAKDGQSPSLSFEKKRDFDETFYDWFHRLPDLDAIEPISR